MKPANGQIAVGTRLGDRYELLEEVGRGGFGAVYQAWDAPLKRSVAIKLIHTSWTEAGAELEREATLLAGIRSPHVVRVLDASVMEDPPYLVMELLEGASVRERLDQRGAMSPSESFRILGEVLEGLAALHERTLLHGDLKPENVILTSEGAKLIDLGISRPWTSPQQRSDQVLGTPAYLSPELIRGGQPDRRADLYAAGLLLYEMLSGHPAYPHQDHASEITDEIVEGRRTPLPLVCPWLPLSVVAFVRRALERDPARRFGDAEEMTRALAALGHVEDVSTGVRTVAPTADDSSAERRLGERFRLCRRLEVGSSGQIWEAEDLQRGVPVTVETVHLGESRGAIAKLAELRSPHVPQIHDLVPLAAGTFVLVMEPLPGRPLTQVLGQRLPLASLMTTARQLLGGLAAAHGVGLVHGNLDPSNVLIGHVGQDLVLKLLDFRLDEDDAATPDPAYAAPEVLRGGAPTPRSDVYSAAAVLFALLTGVDYVAAGRPLDGREPDPKLLGRVAASAPITRTLQRALATDPAERFDDARALLATTRASIPPPPR